MLSFSCLGLVGWFWYSWLWVWWNGCCCELGLVFLLSVVSVGSVCCNCCGRFCELVCRWVRFCLCLLGCWWLGLGCCVVIGCCLVVGLGICLGCVGCGNWCFLGRCYGVVVLVLGGCLDVCFYVWLVCGWLLGWGVCWSLDYWYWVWCVVCLVFWLCCVGVGFVVCWVLGWVVFWCFFFRLVVVVRVV